MSSWRIAHGERIYAIGDIHGCISLFEELLENINKDSAGRPLRRTRVIVLGDVIDRGPDSCAVVARLRRYARVKSKFIVLLGNHEQLMVAALDGDLHALRLWLQVGGRETLLSWGVLDGLIEAGASEALMTVSRKKIPLEIRSWMARLPYSYVSGNVLFVHAGIRPGIAFADQDTRDLLWIGREFLESQTIHPHLVVHGHSIDENGPVMLNNRIGVDTGAYRTGRLAAVGLEGFEAWSVST